MNHNIGLSYLESQLPSDVKIGFAGLRAHLEANFAREKSGEKLEDLLEERTSIISSLNILSKTYIGLSYEEICQLNVPSRQQVSCFYIVGLLIFIQVLGLIITWPIFKPSNSKETFQWLLTGAGVDGILGILALWLQLSGYDFQSLIQQFKPKEKLSKVTKILLVLLAVVILGITLFISIKWSYLSAAWYQYRYKDKTVIVVAEISEGSSSNIPDDRTITQTIWDELSILEEKDPGIVVVEYNEVILDAENARRIGIERGAKIVIWGRYTPSTTNVLVKLHFQIITSTEYFLSKDFLTEPREQIYDREDLETFELHTRLSKEIFYLSAFISGLSNYWEEKYENAIKDFVLAEEIITNSNVLPVGSEYLYFYLAQSYRFKGRFTEAETAIEESININPLFARGYNLLGLIYHDQVLINDAITQYQKSIETDPKYSVAYNNLAIAYEDQDKSDFQTILDLYTQAIALDEEDWLCFQNLGVFLNDKGNYLEAEANYKKSIEINPNNADAYYLLASLYEDLGRWPEVKENLSIALEKNPNHASAHNLQGIVYSYEGNNKKAILEYQKAIEIAPDLPSVYSNLALLYEEENKTALAITYYKKAIELDPNDATDYCRLSSVFVKLHQANDANNYFIECQKNIDTQTDKASAHNDLGNVFFEKEDYVAASQEYETAIQNDPYSFIYYYNLAEALKKLGEYERAITQIDYVINQNLSITPDVDHLILFELKWANGNYFQALKELPKFLEKLNENVISDPLFRRKSIWAFLVTLAILVAPLFILRLLPDNQRVRIIARYVFIGLNVEILALKSMNFLIGLQRTDIKNKTCIKSRRLKLNAQLARSYYMIANIQLLDFRSEDKALKNWHQAIKFEPHHHSTVLALFRFYQKNGFHAKAINLLEKAVRSNPRDSILRLHLGDIYFFQNKLSKALHHWRIASKIKPNEVIILRNDQLSFSSLNPLAHYTLGLAYKEIGEIQKAITGFELAYSTSMNFNFRTLAEKEAKMLKGNSQN